jgi:murein DD-endopeptidase MepM/ murein hydrolase activator NlpD
MAVLQLPASIKVTHQTAGLSGYPAQDIFGRPGTPALSPVDGVIARLSGSPPSRGAYLGAGGPFGRSIYVTGADGRSYFLTHFGSVAVRAGQRVRRGQVLGTVGDYPGATPDHIHEGVHGGATSTGVNARPAAADAAKLAGGGGLNIDIPSPGDLVTGALNVFFGGFFDQLKTDASKILLTIGLIGLGAVLAFAGFNQLAGGAPMRAAKTAGKTAVKAAATKTA